MANNNQFRLDVDEFVKRAKGAANNVVKKIFLDMSTRIIQRTPVDTGRARANWLPAVGAPEERTHRGTDPTGTQGVGRVGQALASYDYESGDSLFLTNSLPYIGPLENGHSKQAPAGMVKVTVAEFQNIASESAKGA